MITKLLHIQKAKNKPCLHNKAQNGTAAVEDHLVLEVGVARCADVLGVNVVERVADAHVDDVAGVGAVASEA